MQFDIVTIFPGFFEGPFQSGILGRALATGKARVAIHNLRDFTFDPHQTVDDRPFGGGEGMVLKAEPIFLAVESLGVAAKDRRDTSREQVVLLSAQGRPFTQAVAREMAVLDRLVLICGRYEGVDERVNQGLADRELSIGDYVLSGGELAAAVVVDSVTRLLPGVLGNPDSCRFESFGVGAEPTPEESGGNPRSTVDAGGLLDYPHYTRPAEFRGAAVPGVLLSGDHEQIRRWRRRQSLMKTYANRPDLLAKADLAEEDRDLISEMDRDGSGQR
jgi:tRNA (guanine37-N1)-methyltransferase